MKFSRIDLLTLLISLFIFASCEKSSTIGIEVNADSALKGEFSDTLSIRSQTVRDDVAETSVLNAYPLGFLNDPVFGKSEARLAMTMGMPNIEYNFGDSARLDSAVLVLPFGSEFYGDSTSTYKIEVHELSTPLYTFDAFPSNREYAHETTLMGSRTGRLFPNTKVKVLDIIAGDADTIKTENPQLRIRLDASYITSHIMNMSKATLKSDYTFENSFKGLHIQVNKENTSGKGAMMFLNLANSGAYVSLYYKRKGDVLPVDTVTSHFPLGSSVYRTAATVKQDYTGTVIESQLNQPNKQFQETYLQPLTGLRTRIRFPYLDKFKEKTGKIVINKAELVIDLAPGSDLNPFEAAPRLALYRYDIAEQRVGLPDSSPNTDARGLQDPTLFGGFFNPATRQYTFVMTAYLQDLINGKTKDYGTFLAPIPSANLIVSPSLESAARAIINAQKKNPASGEGSLKLNIYYTKVE